MNQQDWVGILLIVEIAGLDALHVYALNLTLEYRDAHLLPFPFVRFGWTGARNRRPISRSRLQLPGKVVPNGMHGALVVDVVAFAADSSGPDQLGRPPK